MTLISVIGPDDSATNARHKINAAQVASRPVRAIPWMTARLLAWSPDTTARWMPSTSASSAAVGLA